MGQIDFCCRKCFLYRKLPVFKDIKFCVIRFWALAFLCIFLRFTIFTGRNDEIKMALYFFYVNQMNFKIYKIFYGTRSYIWLVLVYEQRKLFVTCIHIWLVNICVYWLDTIFKSLVEIHITSEINSLQFCA